VVLVARPPQGGVTIRTWWVTWPPRDNRD
jgi:hypothetical protein